MFSTGDILGSLDLASRIACYDRARRHASHDHGSSSHNGIVPDFHIRIDGRIAPNSYVFSDHWGPFPIHKWFIAAERGLGVESIQNDYARSNPRVVTDPGVLTNNHKTMESDSVTYPDTRQHQTSAADNHLIS
jgi:hypothetical protein